VFSSQTVHLQFHWHTDACGFISKGHFYQCCSLSFTHMGCSGSHGWNRRFPLTHKHNYTAVTVLLIGLWMLSEQLFNKELKMWLLCCFSFTVSVHNMESRAQEEQLELLLLSSLLIEMTQWWRWNAFVFRAFIDCLRVTASGHFLQSDPHWEHNQTYWDMWERIPVFILYTSENIHRTTLYHLHVGSVILTSFKVTFLLEMMLSTVCCQQK